MGRYGKIEVRPRINGHPVTEYNDTTRDSHSPLADVQVNSLIETVPNSNYEIELITHPGFHFPQNDSWDVLSFAIEVDGVKMVKTLNYAKHYEAFGEYREIVEGAESSSNGLRSVRKFKFQPYSGGNTTTQHGNVLKSIQLGNIKVEVTREKLTSTSNDGNVGERQLDSNSVSERLLKGRDVDTTTTLERAQKHGNVWVMNTQRYDIKPMVTFNFQYASRSVLERRGVLHQSTTSPSAKTGEAPSAKHPESFEENGNMKIKIERSEKAAELQQRENQRAKTLAQLRRITGSKRSRSPSPSFFAEDENGNFQKEKRQRVQSTSEPELIVLDDSDNEA